MVPGGAITGFPRKLYVLETQGYQSKSLMGTGHQFCWTWLTWTWWTWAWRRWWTWWIFCTDCCMFSNIRKNWLVSLKIIIYWLLHILSWQYFKNILTGLKDILADPLPTALHNFPIASSNISDNLETIWSDTEEDGFTKISLSHSKYCKLWKEKNIYVGKWYFGEYL